MSIELVAAVLRARIKPPSAKLMAVVLAEGTNSRTGIVWRGMASLAEAVGVEERAAQKLIRALETQSILKVVAHRAGGRGKAPTYRLCPLRLAQLAPEVIHKGAPEDTLCETEKGVPEFTHSQERVSSGSLKGVPQDTPTRRNHSIQAGSVDNLPGPRHARRPQSRNQGSTGEAVPLSKLLSVGQWPALDAARKRAADARPATEAIAESDA